MGWIWSNENDEAQLTPFSTHNSPNFSTKKFVRSQCKTEEVEPGKFVRKCEKTEELLRSCVGKPDEVVQSNKEYTEEDVTNEVLNGGRSVTFGNFGSSGHGAFDFPGLRSDIEGIEKNLFGGLGRFLEAAEEMTNGFFDAIAKSPGIFEAESSSTPSTRRGIPIEEFHRQEAHPKPMEQGPIDPDFAAMAKDV